MLLMPLLLVTLGKLLPLYCCVHCCAPLLLCHLCIAIFFVVFSLSGWCPDVVVVFFVPLLLLIAVYCFWCHVVVNCRVMHCRCCVVVISMLVISCRCRTVVVSCSWWLIVVVLCHWANRKITVPKVSVLGNYKYAWHLTTTKILVLIRGGQIRWDPRKFDSSVDFNK